MNPVSFLHPNRSIRSNTHPFCTVKSNLVNVKNKRKNLEMTVDTSYNFTAGVFFSFLLLIQHICTYLSICLSASLSPPIVKLIRARLSALVRECIQRQLRTPPSSLLYNWMPLLVHVPFPAIPSTAPLTAGAQWCVPS